MTNSDGVLGWEYRLVRLLSLCCMCLVEVKQLEHSEVMSGKVQCREHTCRAQSTLAATDFMLPAAHQCEKRL